MTHILLKGAIPEPFEHLPSQCGLQTQYNCCAFWSIMRHKKQVLRGILFLHIEAGTSSIADLKLGKAARTLLLLRDGMGGTSASSKALLRSGGSTKSMPLGCRETFNTRACGANSSPTGDIKSVACHGWKSRLSIATATKQCLVSFWFKCTGHYCPCLESESSYRLGVQQ